MFISLECRSSNPNGRYAGRVFQGDGPVGSSRCPTAALNGLAEDERNSDAMEGAEEVEDDENP